MTTHWFGSPFTEESGLSDVGQPGTGPDDAERVLLQRVRDGLANLPADSSSDEGEVAA